MTEDLRAKDSHFAFGDNWRAYSRLIDEEKIAKAVAGMSRLLPEGEVRGRRLLDIGCGSGLHSLSALRLGASHVHALDIDPASAATARDVLETWGPKGASWTVETLSVFDPAFAALGTFDIVYSWGVLHHTGDMWTAIEAAAGRVADGGLLCLALYRTTSLDAFWVAEKRWYAKAGARSQAVARGIFHGAFTLASLFKGRSGTADERGMDYWHDMHDWLGGYPYESVLPHELDSRLAALGFKAEKVLARGKEFGLFGSGCDEFVYRRRGA